MEEKVILVDQKDREIGIEEKIKAHKDGKLHRAFSIFIFNNKGELLLQKRVKNKYHSGGLWTNTCCSHPKPGESLKHAAHRRLMEEMGFDCEIKEIFSFIYKVRFENGLIENEYDHVFVGIFDGKPKPNPNEVEEWKWVGLEELKMDIKKNPEKYTYWLRIALDRIVSYMNKTESKFSLPKSL